MAGSRLTFYLGAAEDKFEKFKGESFWAAL